MHDFSPEQIDALCQRRCAFALYALPGQKPHFCMQADGGMRNGCEGKGFVIAAYNAAPAIIGAELSTPPAPQQFEPLPAPLPQHPATTSEQYHHLFTQYTAALQHGGSLNKVVLARTEDTATRQFSPAEGFLHLCNTAPRAFNVLFHTPQHGTWLCSTPELLLRCENHTWHTMALAGTRTNATTAWDAKNLQEHALVAEHILDCLRPVADNISTEGPLTLAAGKELEHLCTHIHFDMDAANLPHLLSTLPPTPAVSGSPATAARTFIATHPDIERSCYAGYMGPIGEQSAHLYVTLRCMQVFADRCRLYAGGGLMPDSDEAAEWAETVAKMQAMRHVLAHADTQRTR